jgi:hypothetical protein
LVFYLSSLFFQSLFRFSFLFCYFLLSCSHFILSAPLPLLYLFLFS